MKHVSVAVFTLVFSAVFGAVYVLMGGDFGVGCFFVLWVSCFVAWTALSRIRIRKK